MELFDIQRDVRTGQIVMGGLAAAFVAWRIMTRSRPDSPEEGD
jgi:hypothetical protein